MNATISPHGQNPCLARRSRAFIEDGVDDDDREKVVVAILRRVSEDYDYRLAGSQDYGLTATVDGRQHRRLRSLSA